jgi:methylmalonyl-CoA/ethylmalonyl-CoA epimerase
VTTPRVPLLEGARLDHVAVAVRDPAAGAAVFRDLLGGTFLMGADQAVQGFRFVQYRFPGGGKIELVTPLGEGFLARFLDRRGEGVHHITFRVDRLEEQIERLRSAGIPLTQVSLEDPGWKEAFVHPSHANGVLIQLAESNVDDDTAARHLAEHFPEAALLEAQVGS